ncbi:MAG: ATP synthase F0 subunit C [Eubacteriales bacterium]|nr:ATP synthase F0 subunit C [Eubacteriales bacterium]MDD4582859.1 ATP synthase F0 subunit C [Eubacteriales bacterium]
MFPLVSSEGFVLGLSALAAALVMGVALAIGIGQGIIGMKAVEGVARQPEAKSDILQTMVVGQAVTETTGIFAFIIAIVLVLANPFIGMMQ